MQDFSAICTEIVQFLEKQKATKADQACDGCQSHYDEFQQLLINQDLNKLLTHIENGIEKFQNTSASDTQKYYHEKLLELKKNFIFQDNHNVDEKTALYFACENNNTDLAKYLLLKCSVDPNIGINKEDIYIAPLYLAVSYNNIALVDLLIKQVS